VVGGLLASERVEGVSRGRVDVGLGGEGSVGAGGEGCTSVSTSPNSTGPSGSDISILQLALEEMYGL
jgi:hypothetical protein